MNHFICCWNGDPHDKWRSNDKMKEKEDNMNLKFLKNCHFARIVNERLCGTLFKSRIGWWETKAKFTTPYIPVFPGSTSLLPLSWSLFPPLWVVQGDREWAFWSVHHPLSLPLLPPHDVPLLQHGSFPWVAVLQEQTAPVWTPLCGPHGCLLHCGPA